MSKWNILQRTNHSTYHKVSQGRTLKVLQTVTNLKQAKQNEKEN